ncbi:MAG: polysaccharide deacetylase family protein [Culicoidibacterales bacterium]
MEISNAHKRQYKKKKKPKVIWVLSFLLIVSLLSNIGFLIANCMNGKPEKVEQVEKQTSVEAENTASKSSELIGYQNLYPDLYAKDLTFKFAPKQQKTVYLTFDDGPSKITPQLLDILKTLGVKATFFVLYSETEEGKAMYKRIVDEGHSIGVHSTTHDYDMVYQSVDTFLTDFEKTHRKIQEETGVNTRLFRFPGGSVNSYNMSNYQEIIAEMTRRGFIYYDWNVDSRDTSLNPTSNVVVSSVINGVSGKTNANVLMHDAGAKVFNIDALPKIVKALQADGYDILPLDSTVKPHHFNYPK